MLYDQLRRRAFITLLGGAAWLSTISRLAWAQAYPTRPVRVIVPYAPGGPTDIFGRLIAQSLSEHLGKQFYVENIGGAGGNVGMGQAARAAPDGYTILVVPPNIVVNPALYNKVPYDPYKDFDPVTIAVSAPLVLAVHPSLPVQTVRDLVGFIKSSPANTTSLPRGPERPHTSSASSSGCCSASTLCIYRSTVPAWRSAQRSRAIRPSLSPHWCRPHRKSRKASCARWR